MPQSLLVGAGDCWPIGLNGEASDWRQQLHLFQIFNLIIANIYQMYNELLNFIVSLENSKER